MGSLLKFGFNGYIARHTKAFPHTPETISRKFSIPELIPEIFAQLHDSGG
jgi:hypothetical protein